MRTLLTSIVLSALALTGCSSADAEPEKDNGAEVDSATQQWKAAFDEATGGTLDFATHQQETAASCARTERGDWIVDFALGGGPTAGEDVVLLGLEHGCPDVAQVYGATIDEVEAAADPKSLVCKDPSAFDTEDQLKLEIAC